jgi:hypothetical protein
MPNPSLFQGAINNIGQEEFEELEKGSQNIY